ncbi:diacylglycerol/lipid kinase family protein [Phreatobacter sp.]|uniref:diacylglycerol/lipid kinase family protein n=1 Tax=Phreatobacter sp. TaxID=1966341 RepID=UPI003F6F4823
MAEQIGDAGAGLFGLGEGLTAAVLANVASGLTEGPSPAVDAAVEALSQAGVYPRVFMAGGGRLAEALKACRQDAPDLLVVVGGDGTVLAAAEAFLDTATAIAVVPAGTVNQLARDLGVPLDPLQAVAALAAGTPRQIDVGVVNGRAFLCTSVIGPLALLQRYREEARGRLVASVGSFFTTGLKALTLRPSRLTLRSGRRSWQQETRGVIVSVNPFAEAVSRVPLRERLDGGILAVHTSRESGYFPLFRMAAAIVAGRARRHDAIGYHETAELTVETRRRRLVVLNDGEVRQLETPLRFEVRPAALTVIAPAASGRA